MGFLACLISSFASICVFSGFKSTPEASLGVFSTFGSVPKASLVQFQRSKVFSRLSQSIFALWEHSQEFPRAFSLFGSIPTVLLAYFQASGTLPRSHLVYFQSSGAFCRSAMRCLPSFVLFAPLAFLYASLSKIVKTRGLYLGDLRLPLRRR